MKPASPSREGEKVEDDFMDDLTKLLNRHSKELPSNTPDFILSDYLCSCLDSYNKACGFGPTGTKEPSWTRARRSEMAGADYYTCDKCGAKAFYDANLDYDSKEVDPNTNKPMPGHNVGKMIVLCVDCAKQNDIKIIKLRRK